MTDWELNNDPLSPDFGDLVVGNFVDHTVSNIDGLVQRIRIRLQVFLGEWFLDNTRGVPYFQEILEKGTSYDQISQSIKLIIAETPDVKKINSFSIKDSDIVNRKIIISFAVSSVYGDLEENNLTVTI